MKKLFILCIIALSMFSCVSVQTYSYKGNVTLLSNNGDEIESWNNATMAYGDNYNGTYIYPYNNNSNNVVGLISEQGELTYIKGGIVIIRDVKKITHQYNEYTYSETNTNEAISIIDELSEDELIAQYKKLREQIYTNKTRMKSLPKNSEEYQSLKNQNKELKKLMNKIDNEHCRLTGYFICLQDVAIGE